MHIIIDATTTQDQLAYAGIGQYTKNLILSLLKNNADVSFSILRFKGKISTLDKDICRYNNAQCVEIGEYRVSDYKNNIWYHTQVLPIVKKIRKKDSIYFCPYFWRNYPSDIMPTVLFVHDMNLALFNMYSQQSPIHNQIRKVQYWNAMRKSTKCKYILCNSNVTKNDYLSFYPQYPAENVGVTYLGITIEERDISLGKHLPHDYKERQYLIYLGGGINRSKNSIGVIKAYKVFLDILKKDEVDISKAPYLVIAGGKFQDTTKPEVQELIEYINENGLQKHVIFTGFYEDKYAYSLLSNSFAYIHLALYEGFGISTAEALRSKTPTILHKSPVYQEIFSETSLLVDGLDEQESGKAIYDVYMNQPKYKDMVERGYKKSLEFSWDRCAEETINILKRIK